MSILMPSHQIFLYRVSKHTLQTRNYNQVPHNHERDSCLVLIVGLILVLLSIILVQWMFANRKGMQIFVLISMVQVAIVVSSMYILYLRF
jgi:hypothetical protein